jgi:tryptophan synthase
MEAIKATFAKCKQEKRSALVTYVTAGYPTVEETVDILLGLENGGAGESFPFCHRRNEVWGWLT